MYTINQQQQTAAQHFGLGAGVYVLQPLAEMGEGGSYPAAQAMQVNESNVTTIMGTPVFMPLIVPEFTYPVRDNQGNTTTKKFSRFAFPAATLVDITMSKNIVKTAVQGRDGTVKELISNGDYIIRIRGIIVGKELFPKEGVQRLIELARVAAAFRVENDIFQWLGINSLVVEEFSLQPIEGHENSQAYTLDCVSDDTVTLRVAEAARYKYEGLL